MMFTDFHDWALSLPWFPQKVLLIIAISIISTGFSAAFCWGLIFLERGIKLVVRRVARRLYLWANPHTDTLSGYHNRPRR